MKRSRTVKDGGRQQRQEGEDAGNARNIKSRKEKCEEKRSGTVNDGETQTQEGREKGKPKKY